jgi:hypothetical protein
MPPERDEGVGLAIVGGLVALAILLATSKPHEGTGGEGGCANCPGGKRS